MPLTTLSFEKRAKNSVIDVCMSLIIYAFKFMNMLNNLESSVVVQELECAINLALYGLL